MWFDMHSVVHKSWLINSDTDKTQVRRDSKHAIMMALRAQPEPVHVSDKPVCAIRLLSSSRSVELAADKRGK